MTRATEFPSTTKTMKEGEEVAMRIRKAFLSMAVLAAGGLLAATAVMAADPAPPKECTSADFGATLWQKISVSAGPCPIECGAPVSTGVDFCSHAGACTGIEYTVTSNVTLDHVAVLARGGVVFPSSPATSAYCEGDTPTSLGLFSCHEQTIRLDPNAATQRFAVVVNGSRAPIATSIAAKKGGKIGACKIMGVGQEDSQNPLATFTEDVVETLGGKCKVRAHTDPQTGDTTVTLVGGTGSQGSCSDPERLDFGDVNIEVTVNGVGEPVAPLLFSEGLTFLAGSGTCAYKQYYPTTGPVYRVCW